MKYRMNLLGMFMGLLATLLFSALQADAKSLEEILAEKGVITADEYAALKKSKTVSYKAGKGLFASTDDGKSTFQFGGWGQLIYRFTDLDDETKADKSDFDIRRFKLVVKGNLAGKNLGYKFQGDVSSGFRTEDVFLFYKFGVPLTLQAGQFKPPQARQELTSAARQLFAERSLANDTFNLGRDQGLQASGSFADKLVEYRVGLFNGNGPNTGNPDNRHMIAGRLDINPMGAVKMDEAGWPADKPLVNIGASFAQKKVGASDVGTAFNRDNDVMDVALGLDGLTATSFETAYGKDLTWLLWTANLGAAWKGATLAAEYYALDADPSAGSKWDADGYYVQAGYQVIPKTLEFGLRYSEIKSDEANASAKFEKSETQIGANYYFAKHDIKLQADYTLTDDDLKADKDDRIARLQLQFYF